MVSNAKEDLPEPERPVITTSLFFGISTSIFFRLWTLAPLTRITLDVKIGRPVARRFGDGTGCTLAPRTRIAPRVLSDITLFLLENFCAMSLPFYPRCQ